jgi:hypothetical protein
MHLNILFIWLEADQSLDNLILFYPQFIQLPVFLFKFGLPVEPPSTLFKNSFQIGGGNSDHFGIIMHPGDGILNAVCQLVNIDSLPAHENNQTSNYRQGQE